MTVRIGIDVPGARPGMFFDLDLERQYGAGNMRAAVRWVIWCEMEQSPELPSELERWRYLPKECQARHAAGEPREQLIVREKRRVRFIPKAGVWTAGLKPTERRDLVATLEEGRKVYTINRVVRPVLVVHGIPTPECDEPRCHQPAHYSVSDEQEILPYSDTSGKRHERAVQIKPRYYCARHFRQPTFTNLRGVTSEVKLESGARPMWGR